MTSSSGITVYVNSPTHGEVMQPMSIKKNGHDGTRWSQANKFNFITNILGDESCPVCTSSSSTPPQYRCAITSAVNPISQSNSSALLCSASTFSWWRLQGYFIKCVQSRCRQGETEECQGSLTNSFGSLVIIHVYLLQLNAESICKALRLFIGHWNQKVDGEGIDYLHQFNLKKEHLQE